MSGRAIAKRSGSAAGRSGTGPSRLTSGQYAVPVINNKQTVSGGSSGSSAAAVGGGGTGQVYSTVIDVKSGGSHSRIVSSSNISGGGGGGSSSSVNKNNNNNNTASSPSSGGANKNKITSFPSGKNNNNDGLGRSSSVVNVNSRKDIRVSQTSDSSTTGETGVAGTTRTGGGDTLVSGVARSASSVSRPVSSAETGEEEDSRPPVYPVPHYLALPPGGSVPRSGPHPLRDTSYVVVTGEETAAPPPPPPEPPSSHKNKGQHNNKINNNWSFGRKSSTTSKHEPLRAFPWPQQGGVVGVADGDGGIYRPNGGGVGSFDSVSQGSGSSVTSSPDMYHPGYHHPHPKGPAPQPRGGRYVKKNGGSSAGSTPNATPPPPATRLVAYPAGYDHRDGRRVSSPDSVPPFSSSSRSRRYSEGAMGGGGGHQQQQQYRGQSRSAERGGVARQREIGGGVVVVGSDSGSAVQSGVHQQVARPRSASQERSVRGSTAATLRDTKGAAAVSAAARLASTHSHSHNSGAPTLRVTRSVPHLNVNGSVVAVPPGTSASSDQHNNNNNNNNKGQPVLMRHLITSSWGARGRPPPGLDHDADAANYYNNQHHNNQNHHPPPPHHSHHGSYGRSTSAGHGLPNGHHHPHHQSNNNVNNNAMLYQPQGGLTMVSYNRHHGGYEESPHRPPPPPSSSSVSSSSTSNLSKSRGLFSSMPSLFGSRDTLDKKTMKKVLKKEKEDKKKEEKERKRREKEEKKRRKEEKRLLASGTLPRNWSYVTRSIENVYTRPPLKFHAVNIDIEENSQTTSKSQSSSSHSAHSVPASPLGHGHHIASSGPSSAAGHERLMLQLQRRALHASAPDLARVEHVYGATLRRPPAAQRLMSDEWSTDTSSSSPTDKRECAPRMAVLYRCAEGYGFVLRGAKSHTHVGNLNFQPSPEFPALQYLDSVDPSSQAERAGLRGGDFILEINGECVTRASHERVVQLIRTSGDTLALKVVSVRTPSEQYPSATDWFKHQDGTRTLPSRGNKKQAPLPPQRDPRTSLSYSKATSKSVSEGLAEIEKLDQTIAEFDQSSLSGNRRHSLHSLEAPPSSEAKVASVRASHTMKRVSVIEMMENIPPPPPPPVSSKPGAATTKLSPAELRIKKYHKGKVSMERSKSTPDLADMDFSGLSDNDYYYQTMGAEGGGGGRRGVADDKMSASATWSKSHSVYIPGGVSGFVSEGSSQADGDRPDVPIRAPMPKRKAPAPPSKGEMVRISTAPSPAHQATIYANVSEEIAARKQSQPSPYESSFRPGTSAQLSDAPSVMTPSLEQAKLQHRKTASQGSIGSVGSLGSTDSGHHYNKPSLVSFAEDRIYEQAQTFIQQHPNAQLLVTADVHGGKTAGGGGVGDPVRPPVDRKFYEPEPDYDNDSGDEGLAAGGGSVTYRDPHKDPNRAVYSSIAEQAALRRHTMAASVANQPDYSTATLTRSQASPAVTVISVQKDASSKGGQPQQAPPPVAAKQQQSSDGAPPTTAPKPSSPQKNSADTSPSKSSTTSSSHRTTAGSSPTKGSLQQGTTTVESFGSSPQLDGRGRMMIPPSTTSSSCGSSRRSSVQSNVSQGSSSHDGSALPAGGRDWRSELPPGSNIVMVQSRLTNNTDSVHHHTPPPHHPPPPPPSHPPPSSSSSHTPLPPPPPSQPPPPPAAPPLPPPNAPPPPPPPPPLPVNPPPSSFTSIHQAISSDPQRSLSTPSLGPLPPPPPQSSNSNAPLIPTSDILAAVALRRARMENDGPRLTERQSSAPSIGGGRDTSTRNQEALKAAIAQRRHRLEKTNEKQVVEDIESRLNKNRKLQAAKYFASDTLRKTKRSSETEAKETTLTANTPTNGAAAAAAIKKEAISASSGAAGDKVEPKPAQSLAAAKPAEEPAANKPFATAKPAEVPSANKPTVEVPKLSTAKPTVEVSKLSAAKAALEAPKLTPAAKPSAPVVTGVGGRMVITKSAIEAAASKVTSAGRVGVGDPANKPKEIMMHKAPSSKPQAPPPPPTTAAPSKTATKPAAAAATAAANKSSAASKLAPLQTKTATLERSNGSSKPLSPIPKGSNTTPLPKVGTIKSNDFLALAEKARQEYLQKINTTTNGSTNGNGTLKKDSGQAKTTAAAPTTQSSTTTTTAATTVAKTQPPTTAGVVGTAGKAGDSKVSVKDRISKLNLDESSNPGGLEVMGVTEDHSHTEPSLSNGTLKHRSAATTTASNGVHTAPIMAPPTDFTDNGGGVETQVEIIPPPPSFAMDELGEGAEASLPAFALDDTASFVSSVSSLSTLSSEHGATHHHHYDDIIVPPPPPPEFGDLDNDGDDDNNTYEEIPAADISLIPPPVQFTSEESEKKAGGGFKGKTVDAWSNADVLDWLDSLSLGQYKPTFARSQVSGPRLQRLERNDYIELGVTLVGHRMDLQRSIKRLALRQNNNNAS